MQDNIYLVCASTIFLINSQKIQYCVYVLFILDLTTQSFLILIRYFYWSTKTEETPPGQMKKKYLSRAIAYRNIHSVVENPFVEECTLRRK
jgi:hypothetical protein